MRTRKRCYDLEEESTRKRTRKRCYDLNPACSSKEKDLTGKSCEAYGKRLQHFYYALQDPGVVPQENMKSFSDLTQSPDLQNCKPLLENIFGRHPELFSRETSKTVVVPETSGNSSVPETPRSSNSSLKRRIQMWSVAR